MAFTFPLPLADFFDGLAISTVVFDLGEALEHNETAGGEILSANIGNRLWKADVTFAPMPYAKAEWVKARANVLREAGASLMVHSMPLIYPQYDPDGSIHSGSVVTLHEIAVNNKEIRLNGLPPSYQLTTGDMLSFQYGSNPVRNSLHQIVSDGFVGVGLSTVFEVRPFIPAGTSPGTVVTLIKPVMKAVMIPGSFKPGSSKGQWTDGVGFSVVQTKR